MQRFFQDIRQRKAQVGILTTWSIAALALGALIPMGSGYLANTIPELAPYLSAEGNELGSKIIYFPLGIFALTGACFVLEAWLLGYEKSSLKKLLNFESPSIRTDFLFLLFRISGLMALFALVFSFGGLYPTANSIKAYFNFAVMRDIDNIALQFLSMAVVYSFINYWIHRLLHSKVLWEIHKVHHAAEDFNVMLPYRNHPVDYIIAILYGAFISAVLGIKPEAVILWLAVNGVYQSMVHSDYDWKWGWVEYILITPAAHRIHHSTNPSHFNSNLGILSIWDRLFGTYIPPGDDVTELGVPDRKNFNTDRFFTEIFTCLGRWLGWRQT